jgi:hypothetical protein
MDNWQLFADFCKAETSTGGPDPQMPTMAELCKDTDPVDKVWLAGCYGAHHCVPSGYAVWKNFRAHEVVENPHKLEEWLEAHWDSLPVRPECKSHRMLEKRTECLYDFAQYALKETWRGKTDYEWMWRNTIDNISYYNRYMAIKYLEMLRLMVTPNLVLNDLRSKNAWSPRKTLALLNPEFAHVLGDKTRNSSSDLALVEIVAKDTIDKLKDYGVHISFFQIQVMLCEFREATVGGYYPGASLDEELGYMAIAEKKFDSTDIIEARKRLFPHEHLGEVGGWYGIRKEKYQVFKGSVNV